MKKVLVCDIKRFAVHDGEGIRTTLFLKGCPLKCVWCHNPESISMKPQLAYYAHKCIGCGECVDVCQQQAHVLREGNHSIKPELCIGCGKCEEACLGSALKLYGKEYTVEMLLQILLEDKEFYEASNGGVTLSGGECLLHADFCAELLKELKKNGIHTAIDTCGFVSRKSIDKVLPYVDVFLYDIKAIDEDVHVKCTGQSNRKILDNLKYIDGCGKKTEVRIPYVPGWNTDQKEKMIDFLTTLKNLVKVEVLIYHNYAASKYEALQLENTLPGVIPTEREVEDFQKEIDEMLRKEELKK